MRRLFGAGEGNRTLVTWLGTKSSTIELHPPGDGFYEGWQRPGNAVAPRARRRALSCPPGQWELRGELALFADRGRLHSEYRVDGRSLDGRASPADFAGKWTKPQARDDTGLAPGHNHLKPRASINSSEPYKPNAQIFAVVRSARGASIFPVRSARSASNFFPGDLKHTTINTTRACVRVSRDTLCGETRVRAASIAWVHASDEKRAMDLARFSQRCSTTGS